MGLQIFRTKSIDAVLAQTEQEGASLKKVLGPWSLIALGVGAIIGTGIFATIGTASAGDANRPGAGPALMVSFVLTAVVCSFTALCYAEFASMVPVAGSAYTYAYATLGELAAWIIGWDLLLEYAIGNTAVAISWAGYADTFLRGLGVDAAPVARDRLPDGVRLPGRSSRARRTSWACPSSSTRWRWASWRRSRSSSSGASRSRRASTP